MSLESADSSARDGPVLGTCYLSVEFLIQVIIPCASDATKDRRPHAEEGRIEDKS